MTEVRHWSFEVGGCRVDGSRWSIPVTEFVGDSPGPCTAVVSGVIGDKPLSALALHELSRTLHAVEHLTGTVLVLPVVNPFGFQGGTRHNPDLLELNRRFPGSPRGFMTDQVAHAIADSIVERADVVLDLHSGTPSRSLWYTYDYGDLELSASFGRLPVVTERAVPGQLCTLMAQRGKRALLAEFGGASLSEVGVGVEGCLDTLTYLGHLDREPTGPEEVPVIDHVKVFLASHEGALVSRYGPDHVGSFVEPGVVASIVNVVSGETMEEFVVDEIGAVAGTGPGFDVWGPALERPFEVAGPPRLMVANAVPSMIHAGDFAAAVGWSTRSVKPFADRERPSTDGGDTS